MSGILNTNTVNADAFNTLAGNPLSPARAWVNFNGIGTVSIYNSQNVSSITDVGTGQYTVNYSSAMNFSTYAVVANAATFNLDAYILTQSTTNCFVTCRYSSSDSNHERDSDRVSVIVVY